MIYNHNGFRIYFLTEENGSSHETCGHAGHQLLCYCCTLATTVTSVGGMKYKNTEISN